MPSCTVSPSDVGIPWMCLPLCHVLTVKETEAKSQRGKIKVAVLCDQSYIHPQPILGASSFVLYQTVFKTYQIYSQTAKALIKLLCCLYQPSQVYEAS